MAERSTGRAPPDFQHWDMLACLDWPPPPSPRTSPQVAGGSSIYVGLGATSAATAAASNDRRGNGSLQFANDSKARADLWVERRKLERQKLRLVAPFPFFGQAMRFQDKFSALQVTEDGRFAFAVTEAADAGEQRSGSAGGTGGGRRIVTYEGVFMDSADVDSFTLSLPPAGGGGGAAKGGAEGEDKDKAKGDDVIPRVAAIEGKALVFHQIEERGGRTRLEAVHPGSYRFAITVTMSKCFPANKPESATVQALVQPRSPGRPPPRRRQMPYVGTGATPRRSSTPLSRAPSAGGSGGLPATSSHLHTVASGLRELKQSASGPLPGADAPSQSMTLASSAQGAGLIQKGRRRPRPKFSRSTMSLQDTGPLGLNTSFMSVASPSAPSSLTGGSTTMLRSPAQPRSVLTKSLTASAPSLLSPEAGLTAKAPTVDEWRDFYSSRAKTLLSSGS